MPPMRISQAPVQKVVHAAEVSKLWATTDECWTALVVEPGSSLVIEVMTKAGPLMARGDATQEEPASEAVDERMED